ncbi:MAG: thiamine-phosphate kinase [Nitrospiria bacterium]
MSLNRMDLQQIGEFGLIRRIKKKLPPLSSVPVGIGDDAAAILPSPQRYLLLTTDSLVEKVHFDLSLSSFVQIGYKAIAVNISDVAAMGGIPRYFLISLGLNNRIKVSDLDQLYRGLERGGREAALELIGGNTTLSKGPFFISLTMLGEVPKKEMIRRAGAKPGDALYVTGSLGNAAAGLELLKKGVHPKSFPQLVRHYQTPPVRWREGRLLARDGIPSAMIDLSDGLASDLNHMVEEGRGGAELDLDAIPISPSLRRYALQVGKNAVGYALNGGEDYELLFSVPEKKVKKLERLLKKGLIRASRIGIITRKRGLAARGNGKREKIKPNGYDHLKPKRRGLSVRSL